MRKMVYRHRLLTFLILQLFNTIQKKIKSDVGLMDVILKQSDDSIIYILTHMPFTPEK